MTKRIISLLLAVLMFAALPMMQPKAFAAGESITITIGAETVKDICNNNGLDYEFCKAAIISLNGFADETAFTTLNVGDPLKIPKTNQDAADILGVALPDSLKPKAKGETQTYTVVKNDTLYFNFMAAVTICSDFGAQKNKV